MASTNQITSNEFDQFSFHREYDEVRRQGRTSMFLANSSSWQTENLEAGNIRIANSMVNGITEDNDPTQDLNRNAFTEGSSVEEEGSITNVMMNVDIPFDPVSHGLREIGNLASWTVSSCKPGFGVEALRDEQTSLFWQFVSFHFFRSDGPQPHLLSIHFSRFVSIVLIRMFLDFDADESYTPTRITLLAGTGYHDLIPFNTLSFDQPRGWINIPLDRVGGGQNGKTLRAFLLQVKILENHQNGKDTHVRGLRIFAKSEKKDAEIDNRKLNYSIENLLKKTHEDQVNSIELDWIEDPQIR